MPMLSIQQKYIHFGKAKGKLNTDISFDLQNLFLSICKQKENMRAQKELCKNAHNKFIHKIPTLK